MRDPIWNGIDRLAVHCSLMPDVGASVSEVEPARAALCEAVLAALKTADGGRRTVVAPRWDDPTPPTPTTMTVLVPARLIPAASVITGSSGDLLVLALVPQRNDGQPAQGSVLSRQPRVVHLARGFNATDATPIIQKAVQQLVADLTR